MSLMLTADELIALTGRKRTGDQATWLAENAIPYRRDYRRLIVSRAVVENWLGGKDVPQHRGFDLSKVR